MTTGDDRRPLGAALRQAWVGYRRRLDAAMAEAGFGDDAFPDGRVLRICSRDPHTTISEIGRDLGITRQGAAKLVASLRERGYVTVGASQRDRREKVVRLTRRAEDYLRAHREAAREIERRLRAEVGPEAFDGLERIVEALEGDTQPRLREYLRNRSREL